jgi:hypothetical protein
MSHVFHSSDGITAAREPPRKFRFQQERADGRTHYVHMLSLDKTTTDPNYAWVGSERQAHVVRAKFAHARTMPLVIHQPRNNTPR